MKIKILWLGALVGLMACAPNASITTEIAPTLQGYPASTGMILPIDGYPAPPTETVVTPTDVVLPTETTAPIVNDGVYSPASGIQLTYDPKVWEKKIAQFEGVSFIIFWQSPMLVHQSIKFCYLGANSSRGLIGMDIEIRERIEQIGEHQYAVREFFGADGGQIGSIVYNSEIVLEFLPPNEACIMAAKEVLATYTQVK